MTDRIIVGSDGRKYITNEPAQPKKPIAYFDFQERGFYWAPNTATGPVPVARKVEPMPLYSNQQAQPEREPSGIDFTQDEKQALIELMELDGHSSDDFAPECPSCTAWEKLTAAIKQGGQHD